MSKNTMYHEARATRSPHVGCNFDCTYCFPSFRRQAKRQKQRCKRCHDFTPHFHEYRLEQPFPRTEGDEFITMCLMGDVAFAKPREMRLMIDKMVELYDRLFLMQSKDPRVFHDYTWPDNVILGTTIETNISVITSAISKAPIPLLRYKAMKDLDHPRKAITVEPALRFNLSTMCMWIADITPEVVYIGYDTKGCNLEEPSLKEVKCLIKLLRDSGITVREKTLRPAWWESGPQSSSR